MRLSTGSLDMTASAVKGWTGCVAKLIEVFGMIDQKKFLEGGKSAAFRQDGQKR